MPAIALPLQDWYTL